MASLRWPSVRAAFQAWLAYEPNERALLTATGRTGGEGAATWDAASTLAGRPCRTAEEAFAACCQPRRVASHTTIHRTLPDGRIEQAMRPSERLVYSWDRFDLDAWRDCVPGAELPPDVYDALADAAERAFLDGSGPTDDDDTSARPWAGLHAIPADYDGYVDAEQEAWYQVAAEPPPAPAAPTWDPAIVRALLDRSTWLCQEHVVTEVDIVAEACLWMPPPRLPAHAWR